jgi:3-phytase
MISVTTYIFWLFACLYDVDAQDANITLVPAAQGFEADNTAFYYSSSPVLLANDGSAADGGFRVFTVSSTAPFTQTSHQKTGRSKIVVPVYDVGGRDIFVTIAAPDSIMRVFNANTISEIVDARKKVLGDWSTLCVWRSSKSGNSYLFLFGKKQVVQLLVRGTSRNVRILEVG